MTTKARIVLHIDQTPEKFKLSPRLADMLQMKEASRASITSALWSYVKINKLQDKVDRRIIRPDERLRSVRLIDDQDEIKLLTFFVYSCSTSNRLRSNKYLSW